jgi:hypothetical protein
MDDAINKLILDGALEVSGVDSKTGELLYSFTPKLKDVSPILYKEMQDSLSRDMMFLWENGYVQMDVTVENPIVTATKKAFIQDEILKLNDYYQNVLSEFKRISSL